MDDINQNLNGKDSFTTESLIQTRGLTPALLFRHVKEASHNVYDPPLFLDTFLALHDNQHNEKRISHLQKWLTKKIASELRHVHKQYLLGKMNEGDRDLLMINGMITLALIHRGVRYIQVEIYCDATEFAQFATQFQAYFLIGFYEAIWREVVTIYLKGIENTVLKGVSRDNYGEKQPILINFFKSTGIATESGSLSQQAATHLFTITLKWYQEYFVLTDAEQ